MNVLILKTVKMNLNQIIIMNIVQKDHQKQFVKNKIKFTNKLMMENVLTIVRMQEKVKI